MARSAHMVGQGVVGARGSVQDTLKFSILLNVELLGTSYKSLPVLYSNKINLPTIGNRVLDYYAVTLDLEHETIYLEEYADMEASSFRSFGFEVDFKEGAVYVTRLIRDSPAEKVGLRLGSKISHMNHQLMSFSDYCSFQKAVNAYFENDDIIIDVNIDDGPQTFSLRKESFSE